MKTILIVGMIIECIVLILLTVLKKWTKKIFIAVSAVTAICCVVVWTIGYYQKSEGQQAEDLRSSVYMAARLLQEGYPSETLNVLSNISDEEGIVYNGRSLRALAYNLNGTYETVENYLQDGENSSDDQLLLEISVAKKPADESLQDAITKNALELIAATEVETRQWEAEMKVRFLGFSLTEDEKATLSSDLALVKEAIEDYRYEEAYTQLVAVSGNSDIKNAILISNMYVKNYNRRIMSDTDSEYSRLWKEAAEIQAELNLASLSLPEGDTSSEEYQDYQKLRAKYDMATDALQEEAVKRAVNYLQAVQVTNPKYEIGYELQLARLYFMSNQQEKSRECLEKIFTSNSLDETVWLGREMAAFREACILYLSNPLNSEYEKLFDGLMASLYQNMFDENYSSFKEFVVSYLRDLYGGFMIRRVDASDLPEVTAEVSVTRNDLEIDDKTLIITDTKETISDYSVEMVEVNDLRLSLVLDRSGSMEGSNLAESKNAIRDCISQMSDAVLLSFVTFESSSKLECDLTDSRYMVMSLVDGIQTTGGTNIASGLSTAIDTLRATDGTKVVILLSDGFDGDESKGIMDNVLAEAVANDITVYTIGLEGCDESYLQNIANQTGGQFIMVTNIAELNRTYQEIQKALMNNYLITYEAVNDEEESRSLIIKNRDSFAEARKEYSINDNAKSPSVYVDETQEAGYYRQTGGTGGKK